MIPQNKLTFIFSIGVLVCILTSSLSHSSEQIIKNKQYKATDAAPLELSLIYSSIYKKNLPPLIQTKLNELSNQLMTNFSKLSKEEIYFIAKSEIYKTILSERLSKKSDADRPHPNIEEIEKRVLFYLDDKQLTPFASWVLTAILKDLQVSGQLNVTTNKTYSLLLPWVYYIMSTDPISFNNICHEIAISSLEVILQQTTILISLSKFNDKKTPEPTSDVTTTSYLVENDTIIVNESEENSLEDFLKSETEPITTKEKTTTNNWVPKDDNTLPLSKPDPTYTPPSVLPVPVSSWDDLPINSNSINLFPTPEPNYQPPSQLPVPVDDW